MKASVQEGIHLESISNKNPIDVYHQLIIEAFEHVPQAIEQGVLSTFTALDLSSGEIDFEQERLRKPTATWTYMINDSFFQKRLSLREVVLQVLDRKR